MIGLSFLLGIVILIILGWQGVIQSSQDYQAGRKPLPLFVIEIIFAALISFGIFVMALLIFSGKNVYAFELVLCVFVISLLSLWLPSIAFRWLQGNTGTFFVNTFRIGMLFVIPYILYFIEPVRKWLNVSIYY